MNRLLLPAAVALTVWLAPAMAQTRLNSGQIVNSLQGLEEVPPGFSASLLRKQANRLPDCFADWYRQQLTLVAQETLSPSPRDPLLVDKNGRQLTVQLIPDHFRDEHLLLLNEKRSDAAWNTLSDYGLTPRESEVLAWVAKGKTNAEVGVILQMSDRTVQKHLEHIYQKLGVETRTTATLRALQMLGINTP